MQENKPVGTSILQLVVTDRDSFHNGPPFSFSILSGNEEEEFVLDPHGILRSAVVFRHTESPEYVLCVQVRPRPPSTSGRLSLVLLSVPPVGWVFFVERVNIIHYRAGMFPFNLKFNFTPIKAVSLCEIEQEGREASLFRRDIPIGCTRYTVAGLISTFSKFLGF